MGLNDQSKSLSNNRGPRKFIFKDGVRFTHMTGKDARLFRLLPAFDPNNANPATSWWPSVDPNGNLTDFAIILHVVRFVGHGKGGGGARQDLLSLRTFGDDRWCPLQHLYQFIQSDRDTWGYLLEDIGDKASKEKIRAAFGRATQQLVANVLDINQSTMGAQLGVFTQSATAAIIDRKDGLVFQPNASPDVEEQIKRDYRYAYANGDITDPNTAPVLKCEKEDNKGEFSGYRVVVALDSKTRVMRRAVDQSILATRYNLMQCDTYLNVPTEEDLVNSLVTLLNGRSPAGYHEYALLKAAFPQFRIPEPPSMGGSPVAASVPSAGFGPSMGHAPAMGTMGAVPGGLPPSFGVPSAPVAPAPVPSAPVPAAPAMGSYAPPAAAPATTTSPLVPVMPAAPVAAPVAAAEPVMPGDAVVGGFNQSGFLARLRGAQG